MSIQEWTENETNRNERPRKNNEKEKQREEEHTKAALPIHVNVVIVREGSEKDGEEIMAFLMSTPPGHPVIPHGLVLGINEAVEPPISLKIVTHVLYLRGVNIQNKFITNEHLDEELASLNNKWTAKLGLQK